MKVFNGVLINPLKSNDYQIEYSSDFNTLINHQR
jgi:hypothetical protein